MKIAIIVHAFYPRLWPEVAKCVRSFDGHEHDVFVTLPENAAQEFEDEIRRDFPAADVKHVANRGFDVGPFVEVLHRLDLNRYDFVVKLHTKRNRFGVVNFIPLFGGQWRRKLLAFCRAPKDAERCLMLFAADSQVGMVGHGELIVRPWDEMVPNPPRKDAADHRAFVGGTMFIARAALMKRVCERVAFEDFEPTQRDQMASLAHEWERKLGYLIAESGYEIAAYPRKGLVYRLVNPLTARAYRIFRA